MRCYFIADVGTSSSSKQKKDTIVMSFLHFPLGTLDFSLLFLNSKSIRLFVKYI